MSMRKLNAKLLAAFLAAFLLTAGGAAAHGVPGYADGQSCPEQDPPKINVTQTEGMHFLSQSKTAFQIAREKAQKYGLKMPMEVGNIGESTLRGHIDLYLDTYPEIGCIFVEEIKVQIIVDNRFELAKDHENGTCIFSELHVLEKELLQLDHQVVNAEVQKLRKFLRSLPFMFGPVQGVNVDEERLEKTREMRGLIEAEIAKMQEKIEVVRQENDIPEFYDEIKRDCAGG